MADISPSAPARSIGGGQHRMNPTGPSRHPKIALVQSGLGAGGTEKVLACLARHLNSKGYEVSILAVHGRPGDSYYPVPDTIQIRTMEEDWGPNATKRTLRRVAWLRGAISGHDLVLSCLTKINVQTALAVAGLGLRRIASERNNFLAQRMNPIWRMAMPLALAGADRVVMQTAAARDALPTWAARRASIIANPVFLTPATDPIRPPGPHLVAVGRLDDQKGFDVLLHALRIALDQGHALPLTLYGEGEQDSALKSLATSLGVRDLVSFAGRTSVPHGWAQDPGIFVLSSRFEGFPNVLIEAMSSGFAPLATRCDWGPSEIITDGTNGLLVPIMDAPAMAAAMIRLADDQALRQRLSRAAQTRAADFSEERIMALWEREIADVLCHRAAHGRQTGAVA